MLRPVIFHKITMVGIGSIIVAAIFSSILLYFLLQVGIRRSGAFTASLFQYMGPFIGAIVSIPLFGEKPTLSLAIGGILILSGVFYATTYSQIKKYISAVLQ